MNDVMADSICKLETDMENLLEFRKGNVNKKISNIRIVFVV